jgi:lysophospholipase L1-like esterase
VSIITKPTHGATGWDTAVNAVIDDHNTNPFTNGATDVSGATVGGLVAATAVDGAGSVTALGMAPPPAKIGNRVAFLGDSITKGSDNPSTPANGASWPTYAGLISKQRIFKVVNAGVSGDTSAQMLARFDTDVTPYRPSVVTVAAGRNDINSSVSFATFQSNIVALVAKVRRIGATPVLGEITPTNSANRQPTLNWNVWLKFYAASEGLSLLPFHSALVDPITGNYLGAYNSGDNTHPSELGYAVMGKVAAATLAPLLRDWTPPLPDDATDTSNLRADGILQAPLDGNGAPAGSWNVANPSMVTATLDTSDPSVKGGFWKGVVANNASDVQLYRNGQTGVTAGHLYAFTGRVKSALTAGRIQAAFTLNGTTSTTGYGLVDLYQQLDDAAWWITATAPAGSTTVDVNLKIMAGSTGTAQFAQIGVYDLTALGVSALA